MKKSISVIILTILAIVILVGIEWFLVVRIFRLETERFDYRYREIVQGYLDKIDMISGDKAFQEAYARMNSLGEKYLQVVSGTEFDTLSFRTIVLKDFAGVLNKYQKMDEVLSSWLSKNKEEPNFKSVVEVTELVLFNQQDILPVYNIEVDESLTRELAANVKPKQKPVYSYAFNGSNFAIGFNYYVDFTNKKALIFGRIWGSLFLSFLALVIVGFLFIFSVSSLMEERRLSQLKTDFINNMTHELKTPLSTISIATRTLENDSVLDNRERTRETVSIIHRQNRQLTKQINHLLEISMWERKQFSLERQMLEVEPFFTGIAEAFRWECKEHGCVLTETYHIKTPRAWLDEVQMTIAVHNLLVNGVKYNTGSPEIHLEVLCEDKLKIQVTDNGIGIPREDQKHIFDKFYRVSTGNIHKVKGLGLGLFYVRQIAEAHGGTVEVASRPGKGSTFTINIPVHGKNQNPTG